MAPAKAAWNNVGGVLRRSIAGVSDSGSVVAASPLVPAVEPDPAAAATSAPATPASGRLSFIESVSTLDISPAKLGCDETMVFFNDSPNFVWQRPDELADVRSGVICAPSNFDYAIDSPDRPPEPALRLTALANYDRWMELDDEQYAEAKRTWYERLVESALQFIPDFRSHVVAMDMFTPKTIRHFTGHDNGAVYGAPQKRYDGTTTLKNLFLCGTDQGLVGIIGAMTSGIVMANRLLGRVLPGARAPSGQ
jgi:phytoene dehydrogenase-like protein